MPPQASSLVNQATELLVGTPVSVVSSGIKTISRPIKAVGDAIVYNIVPSKRIPQEVISDEEGHLDERLSLEGTLFVRKGKSTGNTAWKWRLVCLDFANGGSITVYRIPKHVRKKTTKLFRDVYSKIHRAKSVGKSLADVESREAVLHFGSSIPWIVKDVNDGSCFVIEIPTTDPRVMMHFHDDDMGSSEGNDVDDSFSEYSERLYGSSPTDTHMDKDAVKGMESDYYSAKGKSRPMRFYLKCPRRGNEKTLWLKAFDRLDRLSTDIRVKHNLTETLSALTTKRSRLRSAHEDSQFFRDTRQLEIGPAISPKNSIIPSMHEDVESLTRSPRRNRNMEFRVSPTYCYPHVWLTEKELKEECNLPSTEFHDLRIPSQKHKEIGALRVEVLQCMGLPKLDRNSESDAVVYLVCGSYAFSTDVIPSNKNPIWLRKSRRACIFPVTDGFARLYAGVFDDDPKDTRDDFAGRVVIDLARLRPGSSYDVLLPLRQSAHVFSRKACGAIRLRFQLDWNERRALLSYLPKTIKFRNFKPRSDVTVACTDHKSFRNVAITVYGIHLPKKFTFTQFKAIMREVNFTRKSLVLVLRLTIKDTIQWKIPAISAYVFVAWMQTVRKADFSLVLPCFILFLLLHMIRLYAKYGIDGPAQRGFLPATIEEMMFALINGGPGRHQVEPIAVSTVQKDSRQLLRRADNNEKLNLHTSVVDVKTHKPWGKFLFRLFGLLEGPEELVRMAPNERHLEFPFADGNDYPKISVKEALVADEQRKKTHINRTLALGSLTLNREDDNGYNDDDSFEEHQFDELIRDENRRRHFAGIENLAGLQLYEHNPRQEDSDDSEGSTELMLSTSPSHDEYDDDGFLRKPRTPIHQLPPFMRMPNQDLEAKPDPNLPETKISDDLAEIKDKMHELTLRLFDDRTHIMKHPEAQYFGASKKSRKNKDPYEELERLLEVGNHSSANLIISRVGSYLEPLIGATLPWLCLARSTFNIFTWRDPFMSFWVVVYGLMAVGVLLVFPWRIFFGIVGLAVVGPQNWLLRYFRERKGKTEKPYEEPLPVMHDLFLGGELPEDQPLVSCHPPVNQRFRELDRKGIDPREVHHVVVPCTRLMYQRFYDWPPEARHAYVRERSFRDPTTLSGTSAGSIGHSNHGKLTWPQPESQSGPKGSPKKLVKRELAASVE